MRMVVRRERFYGALSANEGPEFCTLFKVLASLNIKPTVHLADKAEHHMEV